MTDDINCTIPNNCPILRETRFHSWLQYALILILLVANVAWWVAWQTTMRITPTDVLAEVKKIQVQNSLVDEQHMKDRLVRFNAILRMNAETNERLRQLESFFPLYQDKQNGVAR